jgi:hypothetical protein
LIDLGPAEGGKAVTSTKVAGKWGYSSAIAGAGRERLGRVGPALGEGKMMD